MNALLLVSPLPGGKAALRSADAVTVVKAAMKAHAGSPKFMDWGRRALAALGE